MTSLKTRTPSSRFCNRPFPSSPQPPFQSEAKCEVFVMKIILIEIRPNYHNKHFSVRLASKERLREIGNGLLFLDYSKLLGLGNAYQLSWNWFGGEAKNCTNSSSRTLVVHTAGKKSRPFHIVERTRTLRNVQKVTIDRFSVFLRNEQTNVHFLF